MSTSARPPNVRTRASPRADATSRWLPVVVPIIGAIGYALLDAFQFSATFRRRHPRWHRASGRLLVVLGLVVALSALWMTQLYARPEHTGVLLYLFRLTFGSGMAACIVVGIAVSRDLPLGSAWGISLPVAEYFICRGRTQRARRLTPPIAGLS